MGEYNYINMNCITYAVEGATEGTGGKQPSCGHLQRYTDLIRYGGIMIFCYSVGNNLNTKATDLKSDQGAKLLTAVFLLGLFALC